MQTETHAPINGTDLAHDDGVEDAAALAEANALTKTARLRDRARALLAATGLTQTALAAEIGCSRASFANWLNGTTVRQPRVEESVERWLREYDGDAAGEIEFIQTPTATTIHTALAHAQANGDMVCVYGAPGVGKTRAVDAYRDGFEHVWVATAAPETAALVPCLEDVASVVGIHDVTGGARRLSRAIAGKVQGLRGLIVIDEAQHLGLAAIESLRGIHDRIGVGLALVGNEVVYARLSGGSRAVHYAQLFSRIGMKRYVQNPTPADVRAITDRWSVKDKKAIEILMRVARRPGALRTIVKILKLASIAGQEVTHERVRAAMGHLGAEDA